MMIFFTRCSVEKENPDDYSLDKLAIFLAWKRHDTVLPGRDKRPFSMRDFTRLRYRR